MSLVPNLNDITAGLSKHIKVSTDIWYLSSWKEKDCPFNPRHLDRDIEKYLAEREMDKLNNRHTTVIPIKEEFCPNVILNIGMQQSIDRDIGLVTTSLDWMSVGTSATAEAVTQTDLIAEISGGGYVRRQLSTTGTRTRVGQTMKLGTSFNDTQVGATIPVTLREAGIHWHVSDASKCHARIVHSGFTVNTGDLFVALLNELQENGVL